jgi:hypothetical protein
MSPTSAPAAGTRCCGSPAPAAGDWACRCLPWPRPGSTPTSQAGRAWPTTRRYSPPGLADGCSPPTYGGSYTASPPRRACPPSRPVTWDRARSGSPSPRCTSRQPRPPAASRAAQGTPPHGPGAALTAAPRSPSMPPGISDRAYHSSPRGGRSATANRPYGAAAARAAAARRVSGSIPPVTCEDTVRSGRLRVSGLTPSKSRMGEAGNTTALLRE